MNKIILFLQKSVLFRWLLYLCTTIGSNVIVFNSAVGRFCNFAVKMLSSAFSRGFFLRNFLNSLFVNGFCSIPVVGLTGVFVGAVLTLQLFISLRMFGIENTIPYIVLFALMKELAPVLCGLMVVSRVGSSMSAEIGSMATNNQLDVLKSMSINKYKFLFFPRVLSMTVSQPILTTIAVITGVIGSFVVATRMFGFTDRYFCNLIYEGFEWQAYRVCFVKGLIFGFMISIIACYKGDKTNNGAVGIKNTTISTVVLCCVYILIANFVITWLMG